MSKNGSKNSKEGKEGGEGGSGEAAAATTAAASNKKNGRKAKGAKIVYKNPLTEAAEPEPINVILHLKCSLSDLDAYNDSLNKQMKDPLLYVPEIPPDIETYNTASQHQAYSSYEPEISNNSGSGSHNGGGTKHSHPSLHGTEKLAYKVICSNCSMKMAAMGGERESGIGEGGVEECKGGDIDQRNWEINSPQQPLHPSSNNATEQQWIQTKLAEMKMLLYKSKLSDKKAACFWCTHDFENIECYIPLSETSGYGSFCCPECAVGYLMRELIDDSVKFERYHLLNQIYGKIFQYEDNIKPAPDPHYLLEKFYGNMTIAEYRKLLKSNRLIMTVEKPLTRVFPELYEEQMKASMIPGGTNINELQYKVKKAGEKNTKANEHLLKAKFGVVNTK